MKKIIGREKGQIIPIIVVAFLVIIIMAAVILDGGSLMSNRRIAQAAADAGALAGARVFCNTKDEAQAKTAAETYAINNHATTAEATVYPDANTKVSIEVSVKQGSFFARMLGQEELVSSAIAGAGCFPPDTFTGLLPIGWSCKAPAGQYLDEPYDCIYDPLDWETDIKPILDENHTAKDISDALDEAYNDEDANIFTIYLVMDSNKADEECGVSIDCDLNNDLEDELSIGGNTGWLGLEPGNQGVPDLEKWVQFGVQSPISVHTWFYSIDGVKSTIYPFIQDTKVDQLVWIPVYNAFCDHEVDINDPTDTCMIEAHKNSPPGVPLKPGEVEKIVDGSGKKAYHVVAFAPFFITCVHAKKSDDCPGLNYAMDFNPSIDPKTTNTVEGYFVTNPPYDMDDVGTGDIDLGTYIISLTQ